MTLRLPISVSCRVLAATMPNTRGCAPSPCLPWSARRKFPVPITCAADVIKGNSRSTWNWISQTRRFRPACAGCWRWWGRRLRSTTVASRCKFWPTKAVERTAEAIGGEIAQGEQRQIQQAVQLDLPVVIGHPVRILYVQMDGTGIPGGARGLARQD